ncbi:putative acyl-CoA dehydrogenase [Aspergillus campestris IBT 28561]|uniref:Acyl-CoA dehydrogenase n=1 Tax=Aspergillus campestris (strain IBT 28561) TaxID=1392248 RepID=A0A2I1D505_ASPC2|nr:putative acyl-CoA dehydrogenase [Aspergillus campestris IBT 28561]PKY04954.1 putative acyl-CoA dehydrogenase [Aspergillus campestris IBT 28561]
MSSNGPATAETGHFTRPSRLQNAYTSDGSFQRVLAWYLPSAKLEQIEPQLKQLGAEAVSPQILEWSADAERNQPYVKGHNVWGQRYDYDRLVTSEGWKQLGKWGAKHGVVALGYEPTYGPERRLAQNAVNYLHSPASALYSCPVSMSDGASLILTQQCAHLPADHPFHAILKRLLSRGEDFFTAGQWMTERPGGSDVQNSETFATYSPSSDPTQGDYLINGFKFFSSATDANVALLLAKMSSGHLSTFLAPLRKTIIGDDGQPREVSNGVRIHRLKNKLGTKELPTAELELKDMRAHLVGKLDRGVPTIAPLLNITRTYTFIGSLAAWRKAISIAKNFAKARTTVGEPLWLIPMHLALLSDQEVRHRGALNLSFFTVAVMGVVENNGVTAPAPHLPHAGREATVVFRVLTAAAKAVVAKMSVAGIQECQEAMGGVGYMDEADEPEFNVSRILRNTLVNAIWEGTTNVLASELVRFLLKGDHLPVFSAWVHRVIGLVRRPEWSQMLSRTWAAFLERVSSSSHAAQLLADGRRAMFTLTWVLCGALLALDAERDGDGVAREIANRWILMGEGGVGDLVWRDIVKPEEDAVRMDDDHLRWDCRIAWGEELPRVASGHRSMKL